MKNLRIGIWMLAVCACVLLILTSCGTADPGSAVQEGSNVTRYREKEALLRAQLTGAVLTELGSAPAGEAGHAVFLSVCDTSERASVFHGTGDTAEAAWENADRAAEEALTESGTEPVWVKADIVYLSETVGAAELKQAVYSSRHEFFRYGVAFDSAWSTALLEAELNGAKIFEYGEGGIDRSYLNSYLKKAGREAEQLEVLPEDYTVFQCFGWLCDETGTVHTLDSSGYDYGRRTVETINAAYTEQILSSASEFLVNQVREDGSFVYGMYPRFDNDIENYNIVRHASTIWSLICRYRMQPSDELADVIGRTVDYMITQVISSDDDTAYLYEEKDDEIKLGGCGVAVIALTEYMDAFGSRRYEDICRRLGNGILTMLDPETGTYYHVLNGDFSRKEEFRTVYYDGEATFALCRLYGLTKEDVWLEAAEAAVNHFIEAEYEQYRDHWIAYSMNEITKYRDDPAYYAFALRNVQTNLEEIRTRDTTYHTYLELLMVSFELYDRMMQSGIPADGLDAGLFLKTIYARADRMLNGYFYPEYAMYMANPQRILGTFMVRHDGYRVRIDDVQHNIGGYYLYYKNYDKLVGYGMPAGRD